MIEELCNKFCYCTGCLAVASFHKFCPGRQPGAFPLGLCTVSTLPSSFDAISQFLLETWAIQMFTFCFSVFTYVQEDDVGRYSNRSV